MKSNLLLILTIFVLSIFLSCETVKQNDEDSDLTLTQIEVLQDFGEVEGSITVIMRVSNIGTDYAPASNLRLYLSFNDTYEDSDIGLDAGQSSKPIYDIGISSISAGVYVDGKKTVKIPAGTTPGLYRVIGIIDPLDKIKELNETNNTCRSRDVVAVNSDDSNDPDIELQNFNITPTSAPQGSELNVTWSVKNIGNTDAGEFYVGLFLTAKTNTYVTINDRFLIAGRAVAGGLSSGATANQGSNYKVQIPFNMPAGSYKCGVIVDYMNSIAETDELNNYPDDINNPLIEITVTVPGVDDEPDIELVTTSIINPGSGVVFAAPSASITLQYQLRNIEPYACQGFPVCVYLSRDANLDYITDRLLAIDDRFWNGLKALESPTTVNLLIQPGTLALEGTYYIFVVCDPDNLVSEVSKANNTLAPLTITISNLPTPGADDIVVSNLSNANTELGSQATVTFDIDFPVTLTSVEVSVFISLDMMPGSDDIEIYREELSTAQIGYSLDFWVPPNFNAQVYSLFVLADPDNKIAEDLENNNTSMSLLTLTPQLDSPDLELSEVTFESSNTVKDLIIVPTNHLVVNLKIENKGNAASTKVRLGLYISADSELSESDELISILYIPSLAPGEIFDTQVLGNSIIVPFSPISKLFTLPPQIYYLGAIVDDLGQLLELYETNNLVISDPLNVMR